MKKRMTYASLHEYRSDARRVDYLLDNHDDPSIDFWGDFVEVKTDPYRWEFKYETFLPVLNSKTLQVQ